MAYLIAPYSVILGRDGKRHECFGLNIGLCGGCRKDAAATAECEIFEAERCSVVLGAGVLFWADEEEVCNYDHVAFGLEDGVA